MFAVVKTGGKQYKVEPGQLLTVDHMAGEANAAITLDNVLMVSSDTGVAIGAPLVAGATVKATIKEQKKGDKILVFKYKSKKRYRLTRGHRSLLTVLKIDEIVQG